MNLTSFLSESNMTYDEYYQMVVFDKIRMYNDIPKELMNCDCCERHKVDFPKKLEHWGQKPTSTREGGPSDSCKCPCRHIARFMCRQFEEVRCGCCQSDRLIDRYSINCSKCKLLVCEYCYTYKPSVATCDSCVEVDDDDESYESLGSEDSTRSSDSSESNDSFIDDDGEMSDKVKRKLKNVIKHVILKPPIKIMGP